MAAAYAGWGDSKPINEFNWMFGTREVTSRLPLQFDSRRFVARAQDQSLGFDTATLCKKLSGLAFSGVGRRCLQRHHYLGFGLRRASTATR